MVIFVKFLLRDCKLKFVELINEKFEEVIKVSKSIIQKRNLHLLYASLLDAQQQLEGSYKTGSVCPSVHPSASPSVCPSVCPGVFLELYHKFFLNFGMVLENHMKLCMTELDFPETIFCPKNWENGPKTGFFEKFGH